MTRQPTLFSSDPNLPAGFEYREDVVSEDEQRDLVRAVERLEFASVEMVRALQR